MLDELRGAKDKLINVTVQPLNDLADRVIDKESEIDGILNALNDLKAGMSDKSNDLKVEKDKVKDLDDTVASMLEQDKGRKIGQADSALKDVDDLLDDLNGQRDEASKNLENYKGCLDDALANKEALGEDKFQAALEEQQKAIKEIEGELADVDKRMKGLGEKKDGVKKRLKRINENPEKASSQEIDDLLDDLKKQQALSEQAKDEIDKQGKRIAKKIDELKDLVDKAHNKKGIENEVEGLLSDANDGLRSMKEALDTVPSLLGKMLYTLDEMKKGSEPDDSADYWEERDQINKQTEQLQELKAKFNQLDQDRQAS